MLDTEILDYLAKHNFAVDAQDCLMRVLNTSRQITERNYDFNTGMMTIRTADNVFTFKWNLGKP